MLPSPPPPPLPPYPETSKGLCTNSHYCSLCRSLRHCRWDRGWPFQTPGLFCSTTMMGKSQPANRGSGVKDLDLSVILQYQRWSHTWTHARKKTPLHHHKWQHMRPTLDLFFPRRWCKKSKKKREKENRANLQYVMQEWNMEDQFETGMSFSKVRLKTWEWSSLCSFTNSSERKDQLFSFLESLLTGYWHGLLTGYWLENW